MEGVASLLECAVALAALPGEKESGDRHFIKELPGGVVLGVADGLGHGPEAAEVAQIAVRTIEQHAEEPAMMLIERCHRELRGTRGVVMSVASISARTSAMTWIGVGNVEGYLVRADTRLMPDHEDLLLRGGVVGGMLPPLRATVVSIFPGDTLVFVTDGISPNFTSEVDPCEPPLEIANRIMERHKKGTDDALVLVARYLGRSR